MRKRFEAQLRFGLTPIEDVKIPEKSRDELPPVLASLQWIVITPEINEKIFELLEERVCGNKKETGRSGMDLWHILVLGVVRLALDWAIHLSRDSLNIQWVRNGAFSVFSWQR